MTTYKQYLLSILSRASDAMALHDKGELSEFLTAVSDIEDDVAHLMIDVNKDEAIHAMLEAEAKAQVKS